MCPPTAPSATSAWAGPATPRCSRGRPATTTTPTQPTDQPTSETSLPDVSGRLDNSKVIDDEGGSEASYDPATGKITINDTQSNDDDNGTV